MKKYAREGSEWNAFLGCQPSGNPAAERYRWMFMLFNCRHLKDAQLSW